MEAPLSQTQLRLIEQFSNRRFDCEWWNCANVRRVIRGLLEQIKYLEVRGQKSEVRTVNPEP